MTTENEDELETERTEAIGAEMALLLVEMEQRFPHVVTLKVDSESGEIVDSELHNAGPQYHDEFHQAQQFMKEKITPLAKKAIYGDKSDEEITFELMHKAIHQYPNVFSFDTDEQDSVTGFRVKYDSMKNSARTIKEAELYCKRLYEELAALDIQLQSPIF